MRSRLITGLFVAFAAFPFSCKKDASLPITIVGKWQVTKQRSKILNNGTLLSSSTKTTFTADDFVQFFKDGSGYFSQHVQTSPTIIEFNYVLSGNSLKIYTSSVSGGVPATITNLLSNSLSIHSESLVIDQYNPAQTDNEIDDYDYSHAN